LELDVVHENKCKSKLTLLFRELEIQLDFFLLATIPSSGVVKDLEGENGPVPTVVSARTRNSYTVSAANHWRYNYC